MQTPNCPFCGIEMVPVKNGPAELFERKWACPQDYTVTAVGKRSPYGGHPKHLSRADVEQLREVAAKRGAQGVKA